MKNLNIRPEFLKNISANLWVIIETTTDEETKEKLTNLRVNIASMARSQETINCSYIHNENVIKDAKNRVSKISSMDDLINEV